MQRDETNLNRHRASLDTLLTAEKEALAVITDIQHALDQHIAKNASTTQDHDTLTLGGRDDKGKGKERVVDEDDDPKEVRPRKAMDEYLHTKTALIQRIRECHVVLHKVYFLKGDVRSISSSSYSALILYL